MNGIAPLRYPVFALLLMMAAPLWAGHPVIHFDLPPTVVATPVTNEQELVTVQVLWKGTTDGCHAKIPAELKALVSPKLYEWHAKKQKSDSRHFRSIAAAGH